MSPEAYRILDELLADIAQLKALYSDPAVIPWGRGRARDRVFAVADKLRVEKAKPMAKVIKKSEPWSPWNGGQSA